MVTIVTCKRNEIINKGSDYILNQNILTEERERKI